jgi:hypothetical protein
VPHELTPEGRERLSRLAKQRHASGRFGDPVVNGRKGGRPKGGSRKKARISKRVAEAAAEDRNSLAIIQVFKDAIHPNQPMTVRLKGAQAWADIAAQHQKMELSEQAQEQAQHSRQDLLSLLSEKLTTGPTATILRGQIESETGITEADVVEEPNGNGSETS